MNKAAFLLVFGLPALAADPSAAADGLSPDATGYVVRVDTGTDSVYLDFGQKSGAEVGQPFIVYEEGDDLTHPVTGHSLGRVEIKVAEGAVREIHPSYSVGHIGKFFGKMSSGMRARLTPPASRMAPAAPRADAGAFSAAQLPRPGSLAPVVSAPEKGEPAPLPPVSREEAPSRAPRWRSPAFAYEINGMAVADFGAAGKPQTALAEQKRVNLYSYPPAEDKPLAQYELPGNGRKILSLEAFDFNGNGRAELFVSYFNETFTRAETLILELAADGQWKKIDDIPWLVRAHQDERGQPTLAIQQLEDDRTFPFSTIYPLTYQDGKYAAGKKALRFKRVDWIYALGTADVDGGGLAPVYLTDTNRLRLDFKKGHWRSAESFGQTPLRITWAGRILQFHPPIRARYTGKGFDGLYVVKNIASLGGFAGPFGVFSSAEVHRLHWNGIGLVDGWKSALSGYCTALASVPHQDGAWTDLAVAVVGTSGKSSVWIYDP